ncbi:ribonuclease P protein component [Roseococcus sp. YIM B11640]|uniref:ribonuclease P protein component n=1 Tax=Roseococcus sp. YIM B11640 TaxID=3133973 RepID=UPI003C7B8A03
MLGRLKRRAEFVQAAKAGRRAARDSIVLQALPRADGETRLGFTATKKIGNAVARNRAKRRMRAAARLALGASPTETGWNLVLIARDSTGSCPFPSLMADLDNALRKAGVSRT